MALFFSLLAHGAVLAGTYWYSRERMQSSADIQVQTPLGGVFVSEDAGTSPLPKQAQLEPQYASPPQPESQTVSQPQAESLNPGGGSSAGEARPIGEIHPDYPAISRKLGEEGEVIFLLNLSADGTVSEASLERSSGHDRLDQAALQALKSARFEPAPANSTKRFHVEFRLSAPPRTN